MPRSHALLLYYFPCSFLKRAQLKYLPPLVSGWLDSLPYESFQSGLWKASRQSSLAASERRGNTCKGFKDFYLKVKARICPGLSYMCHIRSTAASKLCGAVQVDVAGPSVTRDTSARYSGVQINYPRNNELLVIHSTVLVQKRPLLPFPIIPVADVSAHALPNVCTPR